MDIVPRKSGPNRWRSLKPHINKLNKIENGLYVPLAPSTDVHTYDLPFIYCLKNNFEKRKLCQNLVLFSSHATSSSSSLSFLTLAFWTNLCNTRRTKFFALFRTRSPVDTKWWLSCWQKFFSTRLSSNKISNSHLNPAYRYYFLISCSLMAVK